MSYSVYKFDKNANLIIKYDSKTIASEEENISLYLLNKHIKSGNIYNDVYYSMEPDFVIKVSNEKSNKIVQFDKHDKIICIFDNLKQAVQHIYEHENIDKTDKKYNQIKKTILNNLTSDKGTVYKYKWRRYDDCDVNKLVIEENNKPIVDVEKFNKNLDDLANIFGTDRYNIIVFMKKHLFVENTDFIVRSGGKLSYNYLLTENTYKLIRNTFRTKKYKFVKKIVDTEDLEDGTKVNYINKVMTLEKSTIGFLYNCFKSKFKVEKQYEVLDFYVDLYFLDHKIVVECDEFGHKTYNKDNEIEREYLIKKELECTFVRFNPNDKDFNLSDIISKLLELILK